MKRIKLLKNLGNTAYIFSIALVIASLLTSFVPPRTALACHPELSGSYACQSDGTKLVTWTISNWSGATTPMTIIAISVTSGSIDVSVDTEVPAGGSVTGHTTLPGSQTGNVTLSVTGQWPNGTTTTSTYDVHLNGPCPPPNYQLNLSHIECVGGLVEIHFVLLNVPAGITPGTLTYTYGSIAPGAHDGNVWHYFDYKPDGYYDIQSASVVVNGVTVNLHNPGTYAGTYDCAPDPASASVSVGACTWSPTGGSQTAVTLTLDHASLTINGITYTTSQTINLPPGSYPYTWTALPGYTGSGSGTAVVGDCTPPNATASVSVGTCTWTPGAGSQTPVTLTLTGAALTINGVTYTTSQTIILPPGSYPYTWTALPGFLGSGGGTAVVGDCTPPNATASVSVGTCAWTPAGGSQTPVTLTLTGAALTINGVTYSTSETIILPPGSYPYTWTALPGYQGSGSGTAVVGDCTPPDATASVALGTCAWTPTGGSQTPLTLTLDGAALTINGATYTTSQTISLSPGTYPYTWVALPGYKGSGAGSVTAGDCTPPDATASVAVGTCTWTPATGTKTPVTITLDHASLTLTNDDTATVVGTYTESIVLNDLVPGNYSYAWTALAGYKGSGIGSFVIGDCTPGTATASVATGACTWDVENGSQTAVILTLTGAALTIDGSIYTTSQTIYLPPGSYDYTWEALPGYYGSGSGTILVGDCTPPPVPGANIDCYTLEFHAFKVTVSNSGPDGEIGWATNLDGTIVSLGVIANGGSTQILVPGNATTLYLYPEDRNGGWGTAVEVALDKAETRVCEFDPIGLTPFCSYVDLDEPFGWTVKNKNLFAIEFTWVYGPESSPAPIGLAPEAEISFTTAAHSGESMQIFIDGIMLASAEHETCPEFISLDLAGICSNDPANTHGWTVTNSNAFALTAEWRVNGSLLTGLVSIPANSSAQFTTPVSEGNIVQIYYGGVEQDNASAAQGCIPGNPPENPPQTPPQVLIPVTGGETPVLIPVTGVSNSLSGLAANGMLNLGLGFFGLGVILHGIARRRTQ